MIGTTVRYGILSGLIMFIGSVAWLTLLRFSLASPSSLDDPVIGGVGLMPVFLGVRSYRDQNAGGFLTFRAAVDCGVLISLIAGTTSALIWQAHLSMNDRTYLDEYADAARVQMVATHVRPEAIENFSAEHDEESFHSRPIAQHVLEVLLWTFGLGVPASVASAALLVRRPPATS